MDDLEATLREVTRTMADEGRPLGVVIIDTLAASMGGGDENSSTDMGAVIGNLQRIAREFGILILVVTHTGKDESRGIRGWSGQYAGADAVLTCARNPDDPKQAILTVDKLKDGEDGKCFAFRLEKVGLGQDAHGRPIGSAIPVFEAVPEGGAGGARRPNLTPPAKMIRKAYTRLLDEGETMVCPNVPGALSGPVAVEWSALREKTFGLGLGGPPPEDEAAVKTWRSSRNRAFTRGLELLATSGILRVELGFVWEIQNLPR